MHINYIVSLISASKRRKHIRQEFDYHKIPFEFYDAVMPSEKLTQLIQTHLPNLTYAKLTEGEKACFMSHWILWQKCIDDNFPYIYIFEDDILLGQNAHDFLAEDEWLKERFNFSENFILRLETFLKPSFYEDTIIPAYKNRLFKRLNEVQYGTAGYVISRSMIIYLMSWLKSLEADKLYAIDRMIFEESIKNPELKIYQLFPGICVQELQLNKSKSKLDSSLQSERIVIQKANEVKEKRTVLENIIRLFTKHKRIAAKRNKQKFIIPFK